MRFAGTGSRFLIAGAVVLGSGCSSPGTEEALAPGAVAAISRSLGKDGDLQVELTALPERTAGQLPFSLTLRVANLGMRPIERVDADLALTVGAQTLGQLSTWDCNRPTEDTFRCHRPELPMGSQEVITLSVSPPFSVPEMSATATVSAPGDDPEPANNMAKLTILVEDPQTPRAAGGGFGCAAANAPAPGLPALLLLLPLLRPRRRR